MAMAVLVLYQATMAGQVLDGNPDGLMLHEIGSHTATLLGPVTAVTAIIAWRRGHVGPGVAVSALALPVLVQVQAQAGYTRDLDLHVPLGVGLLGLTLLLLWAATGHRRQG